MSTYRLPRGYAYSHTGGNRTAPPNHAISWSFSPSNFTGKEKDEETGYGYFGARYMDHELMTMWLSVDPMAYKYPNISPYAYCNWNQIKLVDPDGMDTAICYNSSKENDKTMKYDRRHYSYDCSNILHYCTHGSTDHLSPYDTKEYPQETASFIDWLSSQNNSIYDIIVLHSCWVGNGEGCFAEQLSKIMPTVMIFAPSDELGVSDKCDFEEVLHNGFWNVFYGGVLVNSCGGGREDTKALQFIWEHISTQTIIEKFRQRYGLTSSPSVILSNILNNHD